MSASSAGAATKKEPGLGSKTFATLQRVGKSLMLPIAVLPAAGLLLRLGQDDLLGGVWAPFQILSLAGGAIFDNLAMLFAVGVAIGFAKKSDGSTALAGLVGYLVFKNVLTYFATPDDATAQLVADAGLTGSVTVPPADKVDPGVFGGIVIGITAALLWQRYHRTKLPAALAFFSGRRLVPMLAAVAAIVWAIAFGFLWPPIGDALDSMASWMYDNGPLGAGVYGAVNRLLIPFGLHHIINSFVWFQTPECPTATGTTAGDLNCFFNATGDRSEVRPVHDRLLPDHDVRPAGRRVRDGPRGQGQGRSQRPAGGRAHRVPHRRHRAAGVLLHVRGPGAVRHPRGVHGPVDGHQLRDRRTRGLHVLRRCVRLRAQLRQGHQAAAPDSHGRGARSRVLLPVPVRHPEVEPAHAGQRA